MKKYLVIVLLMLSPMLFAQSSTKKYNKIMKQYEYYDSSGRMTGYEKWDPIFKQWEYYDSNKPSGVYKETHYYEPDLSYLESAAMYKQQIYDKNVKIVYGKLEVLKEAIFNYDLKYGLTEQHDKQIEKWNKFIVQMSSLDLSATNYLNLCTSWLNDRIRDVRRWESESRNNIAVKTKPNEPKTIQLANNTPLYDTYDMIVAKPKLYLRSDSIKRDIVEIIKRIPNTDFFEAKFGEIKGYIWKGHILKE